jgi:hypothetical protein
MSTAQRLRVEQRDLGRDDAAVAQSLEAAMDRRGGQPDLRADRLRAQARVDLMAGQDLAVDRIELDGWFSLHGRPDGA